MKLSEEDEVVAVLSASDDDELMIVSAQGYITRYPVSLVPLTSLRPKGVKAMNLSDDHVVSACVWKGQRTAVAISDQCAMSGSV
ncbi:MAG: DNA gyrase C-terminal beta-propeller domain-containing protein [Merdibacter sp.]